MFRRAYILGLFAVTASCAYGYAGSEGKKRSTEKHVNQSVKVVEVKEQDEEADGEEEPERDAPTETTEAASPCGVETITLFYYTSSIRKTKSLDCASRTTANVEETAIASSAFDEARKAGLPEGSWYLLVDPKGARPDFLNNDQLLKISRRFTIEYFGRDSARDLLVYTFDEQIQ